MKPHKITYVGNFLSGHGLNPTYSELLVPELERFGYCVERASSFLNPVLRLTDTIQKILRTPKRRSCVIIDLYSGPRAFEAACLSSQLCVRLGKPYIIVLHGGKLPSRAKESRGKLSRVLSGAARIISPSSYLASELSELCHAEVIPNAIDVGQYPFRRRGPVSPKCMYLRALHRNYGPVIAIEALALVLREFPMASLRMAGPEMDDCRVDCERRITEHGLGGRVGLLGRIAKPEVKREGNEADIFLNPTLVDNTPVSIVEAMAMGLCIVSTNVGGLPHLLEDGRTALLVAPNSAQALAAGIRRVVADPELAARLSSNARRQAETMDWQRVLPRWNKVIDSVVSHN